jgi:CheY-like chemotaxis protein
VNLSPPNNGQAVDAHQAALLARTKKILVVDDEPAMREWIETCLRKDGFEALVFSHNACDLCTLVARESPELIITDVMMPRGNGLRALRTLKGDPVTGKIPVIVMSGYTPEIMSECALGFADAFLTKPFTAPDMLFHVNQFLTAA